MIEASGKAVAGFELLATCRVFRRALVSEQLVGRASMAPERPSEPRDEGSQL